MKGEFEVKTKLLQNEDSTGHPFTQLTATTIHFQAGDKSWDLRVPLARPLEPSAPWEEVFEAALESLKDALVRRPSGS